MDELENAQQRIEKAFEEEIRHDSGTQRSAKRSRSSKPRKTGFWRRTSSDRGKFEGARLRFRSDGIVENSKDQIGTPLVDFGASAYGLFLERAGDSDDESGRARGVPHCGRWQVLNRNRRTADRHVWEFVQD